MSRPFPLRFAPLWLRTKVYYRFYRGKTRRPQLFRDARLVFAPAVRMDLHEGDEGHGQMAFTGFYELKLSRFLRRLGKGGGLLVDVGANYGYFSLVWASQKPANRVVAYEASPRNQPALQANIAKNQFSGRIASKPLAAGNQFGKLAFQLGPEDQTGWGGFACGGPDQKMVEVSVVRLDEDLSGERFIEVLKIDTEGADTWVLEGAAGLLREKKIRHIFFEEHRGRMAKLGIQPGRAAELLTSFGYELSVFEASADGLLSEFHAFC